MDATEWIGLAGLVASLVAAVYAGLTYHRPRAPQQPSPPRFVGELPNNGSALSDFLLRHNGRVVDLAVEFIWLTEDEPEPEADFVQALRDGGSEAIHVVVLSDSPREEGDVSRLSRYTVYGLPGQHMSAFASHPAGGRYGLLQGAFIPRSKGAGKHSSYGVLIQIDDLNRALLDR